MDAIGRGLEDDRRAEVVRDRRIPAPTGLASALVGPASTRAASPGTSIGSARTGFHVVFSDADGRLTADAVLRGVAPDAHPWIYMRGPPAMTKALARGLRRRGIPRARVRWEDFGPR